jgi:hypothetical protein
MKYEYQGKRIFLLMDQISEKIKELGPRGGCVSPELTPEEDHLL